MDLRRHLYLAILCSAVLSAQDLRVGIQGSLWLPQGELKTFVNDAIGFGGGFHVLVDFKKGHALRPRFDGTYFHGRKRSYTATLGTTDLLFSGKTDITDYSIGVDYNYYFNREISGFYLTIGIAYINRDIKPDWSVTRLSGPDPGPIATSSQKSNGVGYALGCGWQFTHALGMEIRYTQNEIKIGPNSYSNAFQISFIATF